MEETFMPGAHTRDRLSLLYKDLAALLEACSDKDHSPSLFCGHWGILLYLFYYEHYIDPAEDRATPLLYKLYSLLQESGTDGYNFCSGLTGPFWMLHHLNKYGIAEVDIDDLVQDFLPAAITESEQHLANENFDFLHGSTGIVHFLVPFSTIPSVKEHLVSFVMALQKISKAKNGAISLPVFTSSTCPEATDAFSMAHGTCALQVILAKLYQAGIVPEVCRQLLYGSVALTLQSGNNIAFEDPYASLYPETLNGDSTWSRIAWCYGDLDVALALWQCGCCFGEASWKAEAVRIMQHNIRRDPGYTGIKDTCLCHGAAGAAIIYRKFWQETGIPAFLNCSGYWYLQVMNDPSFATHTQQGGLRTAAAGDWIYRADLLSGSAGVGLALLSQLFEHPLAWQECFLIGNTDGC